MESKLQRIVLVDVDGTISLRTVRGPYEWDKIATDAPNKAVIELLNDLVGNGQSLVFISGREEKYRGETETFIRQHIAGSHNLFLRANGDNRPDEEVKYELYINNISGKFDVRFVLDDRDKIVALWRDVFGLPTFQVRPGGH